MELLRKTTSLLMIQFPRSVKTWWRRERCHLTRSSAWAHLKMPNLEGIRLDEEPVLKTGMALIASSGFESLAFRAKVFNKPTSKNISMNMKPTKEKTTQYSLDDCPICKGRGYVLGGVDGYEIECNHLKHNWHDKTGRLISHNTWWTVLQVDATPKQIKELEKFLADKNISFEYCIKYK